jgi:hypothetical protein
MRSEIGELAQLENPVPGPLYGRRCDYGYDEDTDDTDADTDGEFIMSSTSAQTLFRNVSIRADYIRVYKYTEWSTP